MPNTEVKLTNAESTWPEAAREDRKLLIKEKTLTNVGVFFSYAGASYPDGLPGIDGEHLLTSIVYYQRNAVKYKNKRDTLSLRWE